MSGLRLFTLGSLRLEHDGRPVKVERHKDLALLVYLAVTGERHHRNALAALFWPDHDQVSARAAVRRSLSTLNKSLPTAVLDSGREDVGLIGATAGAGLWTDVAQFHELLATCRAHGHAEVDVCPDCLAPLAEAVALYRGDFLAGFSLRDSVEFDDWQYFQTETLRREMAGALERLARGHAIAKEFYTAIGYARKWLALDPLHEPANCCLMSLYAQAGQRQTALRQYAECARLLERELGVPPQAATTHLYQAIKEDTLAPMEPLYPSAQWRAAQDTRLRPSPSRRPQIEEVVGAPSLIDRIVRSRLVGRERELAQIEALWSRAAAGEGRVLLVSGEAGIGKTRLVREAVAGVESSGARVLIGRCDAESAAPYAPIAHIIRAGLDSAGSAAPGVPDTILADLLTLAPQLHATYPHVKPNPSLGAAFDRQRLFDSFISWCKILSAEAPLILWLEDVHWADSGTLSLLRSLAQDMQNLRLLLVMTYRDAEVELAETHGLKEMLLELDRVRLSERLQLRRIGREQTLELLASMLATGGDISPEFLDSVYRETEGNPFFVEEACKALIEEGKLYFAGGHWRRAGMETVLIPRSVRAAILSRINRLPASVQEALRLAAVLGREFDFATLQAVGGWDDETLIGILEHAVRTQLVAEEQRTGSIAFAFAHALIPFALRESLSGLRLQRLHRRAATAIESLRPSDVEVLAYHFTAAGERGKAVEYSRRAAQRAEALYAYDTAIEHLYAALDMLDDVDQVETRLVILEQLADVYRIDGERSEAIAVYQDALDLWRSQPGADKWVAVRLSRKIYAAFSLLGSIADRERYRTVARSSLETGLALIDGEGPHPEAVRLLSTLANDSRGVAPQPDWDAAERHARAAVTMSETLDAPFEHSAALAALAVVLGVRGAYRESAQVALRCVSLSRDPRFGDRREQCRLLCQAGGALKLVGEYTQALPYLFEAEQIADQMRDVSLQVWALSLQAECFFALDRWDEMLQIDEKRLALDQRYGHNRVGIMCFYCGISANVMTMRGDNTRSAELREEAYNNMCDSMGGTPESGKWSRAAHY